MRADEAEAAGDEPTHASAFRRKKLCYFDCVHDMGDPVGVLAATRGALKPNGTLMIVEPYAADALEENLTPVGRIFYGASTMLCTPASLAQEVGLALGAQAGEARMREVAALAGFARFRRAAETPFNLIYEVQPLAEQPARGHYASKARRVL